MPRLFRPAASGLLLALLVATCGPRGGGPGLPLPVCAVEDLVAPSPVSPANETSVEAPGLALQWSYNTSTCVPSTYQVEVARDAMFGPTGPISTATVNYGQNSWSPEVGLSFATIYYWRVRAAVPEGAGPWSAPWLFYTGPVCEAGELVPPQTLFPHGHMFVYEAPFFQWSYPEAGCLPDGYRVQASTDPGFGSITLDESLGWPAKMFIPTLDWENCETFYWRVAARAGGSDGPWSTVQSFSINVVFSCTQTCSDSQLVAPTPLSPPQHSNVGIAPAQGLVPDLLQWAYPMPCRPEGFVVRLSTEPSFSDISLFGEVSPVTIPGGSWGPSVPLQPATQYWWDVAARVGTTLGPSSLVRSFFTGPECAGGSEAIPPTLLSPADGAVVDTLTPLLRYTPGEGGCVPDGYAIYLATDPDFGGEPPYGWYNWPGTTFSPAPLEDCTTYYWRVAPIQDEFILPWSELWSFRTEVEGACLSGRIFGRARELLQCRFGPGPGWPILGYFLPGERSEIFARDISGRWFAIENPDNLGQMCWVLSEGVEPLGEVSNLRIYAAPEPTAAPTCRPELPQSECVAAGGRWVPTTAQGGYCRCP